MISRIDNNIGLVEFMLDSQRNKIMQMSLRLEMFGVTCGFAAAIGGVFGMNLKNHIENHVSAFAITWMTIFCVSLGLFIFLLVQFQRNFSVKAGMAKKSFKVNELETVFSLMERIEREVQNDNMSREEFGKAIQDVIGDKISPSEKDNFFNFFDHKNSIGVQSWMAAQSKLWKLQMTNLNKQVKIENRLQSHQLRPPINLPSITISQD